MKNIVNLTPEFTCQPKAGLVQRFVTSAFLKCLSIMDNVLYAKSSFGEYDINDFKYSCKVIFAMLVRVLILSFLIFGLMFLIFR